MGSAKRVTVQGPVKEQQPDGMSHRWGGMDPLPPSHAPLKQNSAPAPRPGLLPPPLYQVATTEEGEPALPQSVALTTRKSGSDPDRRQGKAWHIWVTRCALGQGRYLHGRMTASPAHPHSGAV